jgi:transketolase
MIVIRPADANEMTEAYRFILGLKNRPAALICSRQALPIVDRSQFAPASRVAQGAYVLVDAFGSVPDVILIGSGSEVSLCVAARDLLAAENIKARVVSMPSWELFDAQEPPYQQSVLPPEVMARVTVEEASPIGWERYAGPYGVVLGMRSFGMSAPMKIVAEHFGFKAEHVATAAKSTMRRAAGGANSQDDRFRS